MITNRPLIGQRPPRILLGTPSSFQILTLTSHYILGVHEHLRQAGFQVGWQPSEGSMVERNQNALCSKALETHSDVLMLIDSDMNGSFDVPARMYAQLRNRGLDILCCDYRSRPAPHNMCGMRLDDTHNTGHETGVEEMRNMPSGMMMISRRALATVAYPWFFNDYGAKPEEFCGNDYNFCTKARAAGIKVWCDHDLSNEVFHNVVVSLQRKWKPTITVAQLGEST